MHLLLWWYDEKRALAGWKVMEQSNSDLALVTWDAVKQEDKKKHKNNCFIDTFFL